MAWEMKIKMLKIKPINDIWGTDGTNKNVNNKVEDSK